eukprot:SAG22_NODE_723_length_7636_cov_75.271726_8_plen_96_part_00
MQSAGDDRFSKYSAAAVSRRQRSQQRKQAGSVAYSCRLVASSCSKPGRWPTAAASTASTAQSQSSQDGSHGLSAVLPLAFDLRQRLSLSSVWLIT